MNPVYPTDAATVEFAIGSENGTLFLTPIDVSAVPESEAEDLESSNQSGHQPIVISWMPGRIPRRWSGVDIEHSHVWVRSAQRG